MHVKYGATSLDRNWPHADRFSTVADGHVADAIFCALVARSIQNVLNYCLKMMNSHKKSR